MYIFNGRTAMDWLERTLFFNTLLVISILLLFFLKLHSSL